MCTGDSHNLPRIRERKGETMGKTRHRKQSTKNKPIWRYEPGNNLSNIDKHILMKKRRKKQNHSKKKHRIH